MSALVHVCLCLCSSFGAFILLSSAHCAGISQAARRPADGHRGYFLTGLLHTKLLWTLVCVSLSGQMFAFLSIKTQEWNC